MKSYLIRAWERSIDWLVTLLTSVYGWIAVIAGSFMLGAIIFFFCMDGSLEDTQIQKDNLREAIHQEIVELDTANGNVVWLKDSMQRKAAEEVALKEATWFNDEVDAKREDLKAKITTGISPAFRHKVDIYYVEEDGKRAIFIVPEGSKVKSSYQKIN